eukprot:scaffold138831_cov19-Tisochrysis_lutea.AAC.1
MSEVSEACIGQRGLIAGRHACKGGKESMGLSEVRLATNAELQHQGSRLGAEGGGGDWQACGLCVVKEGRSRQ